MSASKPQQQQLLINPEASQTNECLNASFRKHFWTLPQKKPQLMLLLVSFSALSFARLSCLQPADIQDVSAVSLLSCRCALALLFPYLRLFFFSSRCERQPLLNSLHVRYFKTSVVHSRCRTIIATAFWFCLKLLFFSVGEDLLTVKTPAFAESVTEGDVRWEKGWFQDVI